VNQKNRSLIDACGFDRKNTSQNICRLKEKVDIKELVVLVPFNFKQKKSYIINPESNLAKANKKYMEEYCFPPQFDEVYGVLKQSIFMVCAESLASLTKEDLSNIWQNFMPGLSYNHEEDSAEVEIDYSDIENIDQIFSTDADWMIFKIKKRASTNKNIDTPIQYNWPYDNFSLIELAKVDAQIVYENKEAEEKEFNFKSNTKEYLKANRQIINKEKEVTASEKITEEKTNSRTNSLQQTNMSEMTSRQNIQREKQETITEQTKDKPQMANRSVIDNTQGQKRTNLEKLLTSNIEVPPKKKELQSIVTSKKDITGRTKR
jgi:hypothetical protein